MVSQVVTKVFLGCCYGIPNDYLDMLGGCCGIPGGEMRGVLIEQQHTRTLFLVRPNIPVLLDSY